MSKEHKHTLGPWITNGGIVRTVDENGITVRKIATVHGGFGEAEKIANARLIAAAPDMLEAIRELIGLYDDGKSWSPEDHPIVAARAAIAKARGTA